MIKLFELHRVENGGRLINGKDVEIELDADLSYAGERWYKICFCLPSGMKCPTNGKQKHSFLTRITSPENSDKFYEEVADIIQQQAVTVKAFAPAGLYDSKTLRSIHKLRRDRKRSLALAEYGAEMRWVSLDLLPTNLRNHPEISRQIDVA